MTKVDNWGCHPFGGAGAAWRLSQCVRYLCMLWNLWIVDAAVYVTPITVAAESTWGEGARISAPSRAKRSVPMCLPRVSLTGRLMVWMYWMSESVIRPSRSGDASPESMKCVNPAAMRRKSAEASRAAPSAEDEPRSLAALPSSRSVAHAARYSGRARGLAALSRPRNTGVRSILVRDRAAGVYGGMVMDFSQMVKEPDIVGTYLARLWAALAAIWAGSVAPSTGVFGACVCSMSEPASTPPWAMTQDDMASSAWGFSPAEVSSV